MFLKLGTSEAWLDRFFIRYNYLKRNFDASPSGRVTPTVTRRRATAHVPVIVCAVVPGCNWIHPIMSDVQHIRLRRPEPEKKTQQPARHTGILQDQLRRAARRPWNPSFSLAVRILLLIRVTGAMYSNIDDCDEGAQAQAAHPSPQINSN